MEAYDAMLIVLALVAIVFVLDAIKTRRERKRIERDIEIVDRITERERSRRTRQQQ